VVFQIGIFAGCLFVVRIKNINKNNKLSDISLCHGERGAAAGLPRRGLWMGGAGKNRYAPAACVPRRRDARPLYSGDGLIDDRRR
jgi:hypothetical protein